MRVTGDEQENGSDGAGEVGEEEVGGAGVGGDEGAESRDTEDHTEQDATPEDGACGEQRGGVAWGPVGDARGLIGSEAIVEAGRGKDFLDDEAQDPADDGHDGDGEQKREQAG